MRYKTNLIYTNTPIYRIVVALCKDYERRKKAIKENNLDAEVMSQYKHFNETIDKSIASVCEVGMCNQMREDIGNGVGHRCSPIYYISAGTYKTRKRQSIYAIAKNLHLI